jgi:hypothetical protein
MSYVDERHRWARGWLVRDVMKVEGVGETLKGPK